MNKFTEAKLEQAFIELLGAKAIPHVSGDTTSYLAIKIQAAASLKEL